MKLGRIDVPLMLASLVLSLFLWVVVQVQLGAKTVVLHVPLRLLNKPEKVSADGAPQTVDVETTATSEQSDWLDEHKPEIFAVADLKGVVPGTHKLAVTLHHPSSDVVFTLKTRSVLVNVERFVTRRMPVSVAIKGELPTEKKSWVNQVIMPSYVEVSGPEGLVDQAIVKVEIDRSHYQEDHQTDTPVKLVDKTGDVIDGLTTQPDTVTVRPIILPVKSVSLAEVKFLGAPPPGYRVGIVELTMVRVRGPKKVLDALKEIQLPSVDLTTMTRTTRLNLTPILPTGVEMIGGRTVEVTIPITVETPPANTSPPVSQTTPSGRGNTVP